MSERTFYCFYCDDFRDYSKCERCGNRAAPMKFDPSSAPKSWTAKEGAEYD